VVCRTGELPPNAVAKHLAKNPRRSLVYGVGLSDYLAVSDAVRVPVWGNYHGARVTLLFDDRIRPP